ncbi:MAG: alpha/beta hydrolase [Syntrophus sp. (in: bacteria)]|nr:alpha/beta hydrolase [Syntrophus sp. (in: bacteria)]
MSVQELLNNGLALSGGGFRAALFSLGSLWRLNEMGWLRRLDIITSVSGGSITSAVLASRWSKLTWSDNADQGVATNFEDLIVGPLQEFCSKRVDVAAGLQGLLSPFSSIAGKVEKAYRDELFSDTTLQDLPDPQQGTTPRFTFYATSLQTGSSVRISRKYLADYKVGMVMAPDIPLAKVVAASSAFPPPLSPVIFNLDPGNWTRVEGAYLFDNVAIRQRMVLTDGGVYDNMGLEAIWDRCQTVLVCDAGAPFSVKSDPNTDWASIALRVMDITTEQTRALRRRKLVQDYRDKIRHGTYWGISTAINDYDVQNPLAVDNDLTRELRNIRTRLNPFKPEEQGHLINWGYALTDAAMRQYVEPGATTGTLPCQKFPLG